MKGIGDGIWARDVRIRSETDQIRSDWNIILVVILDFEHRGAVKTKGSQCFCSNNFFFHFVYFELSII